MDVRCAACGEVNPERAKFCLECGMPLRQSGGEERRTVTVAFADMVGSTALGERLDQESLRRVVDRYYEEMRAAVEHEGGTVAKFIGDAVMAVWGTPAVHEDDALRAVHAATGMQRALDALNEDLARRWGVRLGVRIGVNTGEVVVDPGRSAELLVGDTLNTAARLEQAAGDGEILVGAETYRLVRGEIALEALPPLAAKGKARPLPAWRVLDGEVDGGATVPAEMPLVGRSDELARALHAFDDALAARAFRLLPVVGSPGVGKTRLATELAAVLDGRARVLHGRCEASGEGATFVPVADVLRDGAGSADGDAPTVARAKLAAVVGEDEPADALAGVLGLGPALAAEETFWAVRRFLEALAAERPLLVVLDDLHWAEPTLLDLVEHLVAWGRDAPALILALARPELRDLRPAFAHGALDLTALDAEASRELVERLAGNAPLPAQVAARVLATTEGNPLFLGETLRMLIGDGLLRREGEHWVATADALAVPPTIHAVLAARLQRLPPGERAVVERAAVIGLHFSCDAVAALFDDDTDCEGELEALRRKELVRRDDDGAWRFEHVLIRDAAYRSLLKQARAQLHERFAAWLASRSPDQDELIGFHLERAFGYREELGSLDGEGRALAVRAADRLRAAGLRALAREDLPAAANLLRRAVGPLEGEHPLRLNILADLGEALLSAGDTAQGEWVIEELALRAEDVGDERLLARAAALGGQLALLAGGSARETLEVVGIAAGRLGALADRAGEAKAHHVCATAHSALGEVAAAEAALDRALVAARQAGDPRRITAVLSGAPRAALWGPSPIVRASGRCLDVVRILRMRPGNRHVEAAALRCQAVLEAMRGRADAARGILATCRATLEELGLTLELHETATCAGIVELLAGEPAEAERWLRAARDGFTALGVDGGAAQAAALLGRALVEQRRCGEVMEATQLAEAHAAEDLKTTIAWCGARAEALAMRGEHDAALTLAERAVALAEPTDALADKADAHMALAAVLRAAGRDDAARAAAATARSLYAAKDHEVGVERATRMAAADAPEAPAAPVGEAPPGFTVSESAQLPVPEAVLHHVGDWVRTVNAGDWDALRAGYAPDARLVDRRQLGWDEVRGPDGVVDIGRQTVELAPDTQLQNEVLAGWHDGDTVVWAVVCVYRGTEAEHHAQFEVRFGNVGIARGGLTELNELLPDDIDAILERFDELVAEERGIPHAVVVARARWRAALNARDWDALAAQYGPDAVRVDHRRLGEEPDAGPAAIVERFRGLAVFMPDLRATAHIVAAVGDAESWLCREVITLSGNWGGAPGEAEFAVVSEAREGRIASVETFEPGDPAGPARYHELLVERSPAARALEAWNRAVRARDWAAAGAIIATNGVMVDERTFAPVGELRGRRAVLAYLRTIAEAAGDMRLETEEVLAADARTAAAIGAWRRSGVADDVLAGAMETPFGVVARLGGETVERFDIIDPDRRHVLTRFHELAAGNAVVRWCAERGRRFTAQDWQGLERMFAPSVRRIDHRRGLRNISRGPGEVVGMMRRLAETMHGARWEVEPLAEHGGQMALLASRVHGRARDGDGPIEIELLHLVELDADERCVSVDVYDADAREEAIARLEEKATPIAAFARMGAAWSEALAEGDWEAMGALYAPDVTQVDHRPGLRGSTEGREAIIEVWRSFGDSFSVRSSRIEARTPTLFSARLIVVGTDESGGEFELPTDQVITLDDYGRMATIDTYDLDQRDAVLARLDELEAMEQPVASGAWPPRKKSSA